MVEPMACPASPDNALKLIGLHPDDLVHSLVAPQFQTLPTQLHRPILCSFERKLNLFNGFLPASHPQKYQSPVILKLTYRKPPHFVVTHCSVRKLHVNVPGWIGHYYAELAENGQIQISNIAIYPLWLGCPLKLQRKLIKLASNFLPKNASILTFRPLSWKYSTILEHSMF